MKDNDPKAQPWHEADEKPAAGKRNAPIGTHSLTGGGASVGMPATPSDPEVERSTPREQPPGAAETDPLLEPRAGGGDLLGTKKG
jgi:hypothetical protein